jgi:hypothetical protein
MLVGGLGCATLQPEFTDANHIVIFDRLFCAALPGVTA